MNDDGLVKLAKYCARTCHVLDNATHGRDVDSLSGPSKKAIEDLGRYVDLAHSSLSTITSGIRTMHDIESMVNEHRNCGRDLREHRSDSAKDCLIMWETELLETLRILDVCGGQFSAHNF